MVIHIGLDSKPFWTTFPKNFSASLACAVVVKDKDKFTQEYLKIFDILKSKHGLDKDRLIFKGFELNILGKSYIIEELLKEATKTISKVYVFFSVFSTPDNKVTIVPSNGIGTETISVRAFIKRHLDNYFPYVCYWDLQKRKSELNDECLFYLDAFQGRITKVWENIKHNTDFSVFPSGDKVNALISVSDLFNHFITTQLLTNQQEFKDDFIKKIFVDKFPNVQVATILVSNWALHDIVPNSKENINTTKRLKRPVFYIILEDDNDLPRKAVELSPHLKKMYNFVLSKEGCLKFFEKNEDYRIFQKEDYVVYYGDKGKRIVDNLKGLGYQFTASHIKDLVTPDK